MGFEIINKLKKEQNLTNAQLADLSGVTLSTLDKITSGANKNPKLEHIASNLPRSWVYIERFYGRADTQMCNTYIERSITFGTRLRYCAGRQRTQDDSQRNGL